MAGAVRAKKPAVAVGLCALGQDLLRRTAPNEEMRIRVG